MKGIYTESFWTATLIEDQWSEKPLSDAISDILDKLSARKDFFHQLRSERGKAEFFIGSSRVGVVARSSVATCWPDWQISRSIYRLTSIRRPLAVEYSTAKRALLSHIPLPKECC